MIESKMVNEWFFNNHYTLSYWPRLHGWLVHNQDDTYILLFRDIEDVQEWVDSEGVVDLEKVTVIRDKREAP